MDVLKILKDLALDYGLEVYGMGEFEPDIRATTAEQAWPHITGQDEVLVYLWDDGIAAGSLAILMDDGKAEIYDYGSGNKKLLDRLDWLTENY